MTVCADHARAMQCYGSRGRLTPIISWVAPFAQPEPEPHGYFWLPLGGACVTRLIYFRLRNKLKLFSLVSSFPVIKSFTLLPNILILQQGAHTRAHNKETPGFIFNLK